MRPVRPTFAKCLTLLIAFAPTVALAQFSNSTLNGRYASRYELVGGVTFNDFVPQAVEVLVFDGAGGVTGSRAFTVWNYEGTVPKSSHVVRQSLAGSYSVDADGLGSLTLSATPVLDMRRLAGASPGPNDMVQQMATTETRQLVVQQGGAGVAFTGMAELITPAYPHQPYGVFTWSADAASQASLCAPCVQREAFPRMLQPRP